MTRPTHSIKKSAAGASRLGVACVARCLVLGGGVGATQAGSLTGLGDLPGGGFNSRDPVARCGECQWR